MEIRVYLGVCAEEIIGVLAGEGGVGAEDGVGGEVAVGEGEGGRVRRGAGEGAGGARGAGACGEEKCARAEEGGEEGDVHRAFWVCAARCLGREVTLLQMDAESMGEGID